LFLIYAFEIDVTIISASNKSDLPPAVNRPVIEAWKKAQGSPEAKLAVFDGKKNLYTPKKLPLPSGVSEMKVSLQLPDEPEKRYVLVIIYII
jgi:hypothetical protein